MLDYPQSGERIAGRQKHSIIPAAQPNQKRFTVRRIIGAGDLWVTEYVLTYDGQPSYTVSIMEFLDGEGGPRDPNISAIRSSRGLRARNGSSGCLDARLP